MVTLAPNQPVGMSSGLITISGAERDKILPRPRRQPALIHDMIAMEVLTVRIIARSQARVE